MTDLRRIAPRLVFWCAAYVVGGVLGRLTIPDGAALALVWPAAGLALVWLATADRRTVGPDLVALVSCVLGVNLLTGAPPALAALLVVTSLLQVGVAVWAMRQWRREVFPFGGTRPVSTLDDLATYTVACAVGAGLAAALGTAGLAVTGQAPDALGFVVWWGRNGAGMVVVGLLGLLLLHRLEVGRGRLPAPRRVVVRRHPVELALLVLATLAVLVFVFGKPTALPVAFVLLFVTVVVATRVGPLAVSAHALLVGAGVVALTLDGRGPFAQIEDPMQRALVAQVYVVLIVLTGLVLALSRAERDAANAELADLRREAEDRAGFFASVVEQLQEGLNVITAEGRVVVTNPAGERLLGRYVDPELDPETLGRAYGLRRMDGEPLRPQDVPYVRAAAGETFTQDYLLTRPGDPETRILEVTGGPLPTPDADGVPRGVVTYRDVTALRHDRDALATFAGVVAHDLKRPLTVITGWTDALVEDLAAGGLDPESGLRMLRRVSGSAEQMNRLLDDLLHYTVVRDARVRLEPIDVSALAEQAADVLRSGESSPRITVEPGLHACADPVLLRQVLDNLLGNAVKYVAPGVRPRVVVGGRVEGDQLVLGVTDNGIGVAESQRERVFDTFHRVAGDGYRGTGLGLAIVRRAVERCGGTVRLLGAPGGGSRFEVRLPAVGAGAPKRD